MKILSLLGKRAAALASAAAIAMSVLPAAVRAETSFADRINACEKQNITDEIKAWLDGTGGSALFAMLPECDREEIGERLIAERPVADDRELLEKYRKSLSETVGTDADKTEIFTEDFSGDLSETWDFGNSDEDPQVCENEHFLDIDGEKYSLKVDGEILSYATRSIGEENVTVKAYFYDTMDNLREPAMLISAAGDGLMFGFDGARRSTYGVRRGDDYINSWTDSAIERSEGWHKLVFEHENGVTAIWLDGRVIYTGSERLDCVRVGNLWDGNGGSFYIDNYHNDKG